MTFNVGDKVTIIPSKRLRDVYGSVGNWESICNCVYGIIYHKDSSDFPYSVNLYDKKGEQINWFVWLYPENIESYKTNKK